MEQTIVAELGFHFKGSKIKRQLKIKIKNLKNINYTNNKIDKPM